MDNIFIWEELGYESREDWVIAGKPTRKAPEPIRIVCLEEPPAKSEPFADENNRAELAWGYVHSHSLNGETLGNCGDNALRVRDQNGRWICTMDIKNGIIYWNPAVRRERLSGFRNRFPKNTSY